MSDLQKGWYPFRYLHRSLKCPFDINAQDENGNTFWHYNVKMCPHYTENNVRLLNVLCTATKQEIDLTKKNNKGISVLGSLIDNKEKPLIFEDIITYDTMYNSKSYIDYTAQNDKGVSMLMCCIKHHHFYSEETLKELCHHPEIMNLQDKDGNTALHYACHYGVEAYVIQKLLRRGADDTIQNKKGKLPIDMTKDIHIKKLFSQHIQEPKQKKCRPKKITTNHIKKKQSEKTNERT